MMNQKEAVDISDKEMHHAVDAPKYKWYHRLYQIICFIIFLGPFRAVFATVVFFASLMVIFIIRVTLKALGCHPDTGKKLGVAIARFGFRFLFFGFGHFWVRRTGKIDPEARFVITNHCAFLDPFIIIVLRDVACVIKKEVESVKAFQVVTECVDPIYVDRSKSTGATQRILARANDFSKAPILIFPEGTICDGSILLKLHKSAFLTPYKVQPMLLRYWQPLVPKGWNSYAWNDIGILDYLFCCMAMPFNIIQVDCLPSITMEKEGKGDIDTFTKNAQLIMANHLGVKAVTCGSEDILKYIKSKRQNAKTAKPQEEKPKAE